MTTLLAKVITINKHVQHFKPTDMDTIKLLLPNGARNTQSVRKIMILSRAKLDLDGSLTTIYDKTMQLSQQYPAITEDNDLSRMPSNVIEYLGRFLSRQESIAFGYVNQQLFIETNTKSFILSRRSQNDATFILDDQILHLIDHQKPDTLLHYYPINLHLTHLSQAVIKSVLDNDDPYGTPYTNFFNNLFYSVNSIIIDSAAILPYIPIHLLFNKKLFGHTNPLRLCIGAYMASLNHVNSFCDNYQQYLNTQCQDSNDSIRPIDMLQAYNQHSPTLYFVLNGLSRNFSKLAIRWQCCQSQILGHFHDIFHPNLLYVRFDN